MLLQKTTKRKNKIMIKKEKNMLLETGYVYHIKDEVHPTFECTSLYFLVLTFYYNYFKLS